MTGLPIPGTVRLVDLEGTSNRKHAEGDSDIILIPRPTNDPNDPLNWSPRRKLTASLMHIVWVLFGAGIINGLSGAYLMIEQDTGISLTSLNLGNALMYLFFGWGCLLSQPLALDYGRRPSAVISLFITSVLVLWVSFMKTAAEWYANRILIGIFFSGIESLVELCVADSKFTHERGFHMGFYNWSLYTGPFLAPIPAGFLADAAGWRWINRMYFIVGIVATVVTYFFFEETMFYRGGTADEFLDAEEPSTAQAAVEDKKSPTPSSSEQEANEKAVIAAETSSPPTPAGETESKTETGEAYRVRPYVQRLKLFPRRDPRQPRTFLSKFFFLPLYLMRYPAIVFSGILIGGVLAWYNVLVGTMALVFGNAPYNFSTNMIGLTYLAAWFGTTIGCLVSGWMNDKLATFIARRNNGIKEPEARLWTAVVPLILHPAGCILYGVGAAHGIHWVGLCFGLGLVTLGIVVGSTLALSYCVDCYKEVAGESIVTVIIIRNTIGFAFGYAVTPMVNNLGLQGAFLLIAFVGMGLNLLCFLVIAFGRRMRAASAESYWKLVEAHQGQGLALAH
ncbi:major facilitator superfamily domain-containing protein [Aspergillus egyptiacus]|nr:major facilitator superfamily domain-containing protein [Aspergillus egyptiacus]